MFAPKLPEQSPNGRRWQFGVGTLLASMAVVAVVFSMRLPQRVADRWRVVSSSHKLTFDDDVDFRIILLLASVVSLLVIGMVFAAGRSHAVQVSAFVAATAVALLLLGIASSGGISAFAFSMAGALLLGLMISWTTRPVDEV